MRTPTRILLLFVLTLALLFVPICVFADDQSMGTYEDSSTVDTTYTQYTDQTADQTATTTTTSTSTKKEETPPPPKTYTVYYDANGGEGEMDSTTFTEGKEAKLARCTFTRAGYTFEGWNTEADGSGTDFADAVDIQGSLYDGMRLYAQWGSQIYLIQYASGVPKTSESPAKGSMTSQLAVHDATVSLKDCEYTRTGYTAKHWQDHTGAAHEFGEVGTNFVPTTDTTSWELATIEADPPDENKKGNWACQGSVVFEGEDGSLCAALAFYFNGEGYANGSTENYDSLIKVVNLDTGEVLKSTRGLMIEHGNDIAYRPDNGHFYVAQGGIHEGFPDGIVELDENLKEVRTITPEGTHNIWNLSYSNGKFYAIGNVSGDSFARGNPEGETSDLIVLDEDLNLLETHTVDYSLQGFSGQGMVCDGSFLYSILVNFGEHDSSDKQRLAIFTLDGEPRGTQRIDINTEVESASYLNGKMYFSTNRGDKGTFFGTNLASTTMSVAWEPNPYTIVFDDNDLPSMTMPDAVDTTYDEEVQLPSDAPICPGYIFVEWNTQADGKGNGFQPGDTVHNLTESGTVTLYAQWRRAAIAWVADNGSMTTEQPVPRERRLPSGPGPRHMSKMVALAAVVVFVVRSRYRTEELEYVR